MSFHLEFKQTGYLESQPPPLFWTLVLYIELEWEENKGPGEGAMNGAGLPWKRSCSRSKFFSKEYGETLPNTPPEVHPDPLSQAL